MFFNAVPTRGSFQAVSRKGGHLVFSVVLPILSACLFTYLLSNAAANGVNSNLAVNTPVMVPILTTIHNIITETATPWPAPGREDLAVPWLLSLSRPYRHSEGKHILTGSLLGLEAGKSTKRPPASPDFGDRVEPSPEPRASQ